MFRSVFCNSQSLITIMVCRIYINDQMNILDAKELTEEYILIIYVNDIVIVIIIVCVLLILRRIQNGSKRIYKYYIHF